MKKLSWIALGLLFVFAALFFTHRLDSINQDIGRHLKTGEIIWHTHSVPKINLFSYTEPDAPFANHHWGSEVVFYLLSLLVGLKGLIVVKTAVLVATLLLLYGAVAKRTGPIPFILAAIPFLLVFSDRSDLRPEIFSYLFLACFLFAIFKSKYEHHNRWLYWLLGIELLWANSHIYFPLGVGLIGLYALEQLIQRNPYWRTSAGITIATIVATIFNPNWIHGALTPFTILNQYGYGIVENQGILFLKNYGILLTQINVFLLVTILFALSYVPAIKRFGFSRYLFEIIAGGVFTVLAMEMIRNFGPFAILAIPIVALNLSAISWSTKKTTAAAAAAAVVLIFLIWTTLSSTLYAWVGQGTRFGLDIPAGAENGVNFVLTNRIAGPVFNNFDVGSYLIWKLYPEQRVFVDGRPEAYPPQFFSDIYEPMQEDPQTFHHYADDVYHINYIFFDYHDITPWAQTFLSWISQDQNWPMIYKDDSVVIFLRRSPQNLSVIQKFAK